MIACFIVCGFFPDMVIIMDIYVFFVYTHVIVQVGFLEGSMAW